MSTNPPESPKNYQGDLNRTLYITNLDPKVREKDLANFFSKYGPTALVKIVRDKGSGKSLSYGFVEFIKANDGKNLFIKLPLIFLKLLLQDIRLSTRRSNEERSL